MTRDAANWFHDRTGELFTESETPFDRDQLVQVVNDSVDPVQRVALDGDRYYGVIAYDEHDGWYEYTRYDDAAGEITIGVCAACVKQRETADSVARTLGDDTDVAREKMEQHYAESHTARPAEIETGATLLSGTTVNGNEAIHPGMDGHGSGVDADLVEGNEALQAGSFYAFSERPVGTVQNKFASPNSDPKGITADANDCIWNVDTFVDESIFKLNRQGSIIRQFTPPFTGVSGIDIDSNDSIWTSSSGGSIYKLNQSNSIITQFSTPCDGAQGIGFNNNESIWNADSFANSIYKLNKTGTVEKSFQSPADDARGVGIDSVDCIWHSDQVTETIYRSNESGSTELKFSSPSTAPTGVGFDSNGSILHADSGAAQIYKLFPTDAIEFN